MWLLNVITSYFSIVSVVFMLCSLMLFRGLNRSKWVGWKHFFITWISRLKNIILKLLYFSDMSSLQFPKVISRFTCSFYLETQACSKNIYRVQFLKKISTYSRTPAHLLIQNLGNYQQVRFEFLRNKGKMPTCMWWLPRSTYLNFLAKPD